MRGRRGASRGRADLEMNAEINVTSLIDVAFTLLVIFIITAPIMQGGIEVRLPQAPVQPLSPTEDPFIVTVIESGTAVIGETPIPAEDFPEVFRQLFSAGNPSMVFVRGDSLASWGRVAPVIAVVGEVTAEAGVAWRMITQELPPD